MTVVAVNCRRFGGDQGNQIDDLRTRAQGFLSEESQVKASQSWPGVAALKCMNGLTFDLMESQLLWGGLLASGVALLALRAREQRFEKGEATGIPQTDSECLHPPIGGRICMGHHPLLSFGRTASGRFWNPKFLLSVVLWKEPLSVIPGTVAWIAALLGAPFWAAVLGVFAIAWRVVWECSIAPRTAPYSAMIRRVSPKIVWLIATNIWLASLATLGALLVVAMVIAVAAFWGLMSWSRRSNPSP